MIRVIIVGGGVIGLSLAEELALRGMQVEVLEKNRRAGSEASSAAAGILSPQAESLEGPGPLLDLLLASISLSRESVYICNVVKCRPPSNRNPEPDEIEACHPFLRAQIDFVSPKVILALGSIAAHTLLGRQDALKRLRGVVHRYDGIPVVVTYHPAALLRNAGWTQVAWEDFQLMRRTLELGSGGLRAP